MKKTIGATIGVLVLAALTLAIIPTTRDEIHWFWASHKDYTASYESYVETWPNGRHATEAQARYDQHAWADAQAANTVQGFERYIQLHPQGKHVDKVKDSIESLHWQDAITANTIKGFNRYIQLYPESKHVVEAKRKAMALRTNQAPYNAALREGTESSLKTFLADFPDHAKQAEAQQALKAIERNRKKRRLLSALKYEIFWGLTDAALRSKAYRIENQIDNLFEDEFVTRDLKVIGELDPDDAVAFVRSLSDAQIIKSGPLPQGAHTTTWAARDLTSVVYDLKLSQLAARSAVVKLFIEGGVLTLPTETWVRFRWSRATPIKIELPPLVWSMDDIAVLDSSVRKETLSTFAAALERARTNAPAKTP